MGLDFSHCHAHWAYGGFNRFRTKLMNEIGFECDHENWPEGLRDLAVKKDGLYPLLNHSDCDGELTPKELKQVIPRLKEIISKWPEEDRDRREALDLIEGMEFAIEENKSLIQCLLLNTF